MGIPLPLRKQLGRWVFGCDVCQDVCPYNKRPNETPWEEFSPEKGAGHYLDLFSILALESDTVFRERFAHTPLRRPKLRGLTRNALTVIGNLLADASANGKSGSDGLSENDCAIAVSRLKDFIERDPEEMLKEHAYWALSQHHCTQTSDLLKGFLEKETNISVRSLVENYF